MLIINTKAMQAEMSKNKILSKYITEDEIKKLETYHGDIYNLNEINEEN